MRTMAISLVALAAAAAAGGPAAAQSGSKDAEARALAAALLAAPEDLRAGATVMGYDAAGQVVVLRQGTNDLICLADDPADDRFEVSCHHKSVEPYIARGRSLRAEGVTGQAINQTRWKEVQEGRLAAPENGASNYILTGTYDPATGAVTDTYLRWVIYTPYATPATTGLTTTGGESAPWLMFPGTPGSHIMIVPPRKKDGG